MTNVTHKFLSIYLFITLYMFRAHSAHHQERQIVSIQPLVTIILCWWPSFVQVGSRLEHRMIVTRGGIDIICLSWWWAVCARNMLRVINKYIERNLCATLVIYQESLHDARSTKCKILQGLVQRLIGNIISFLYFHSNPKCLILLSQAREVQNF